MITNPGSKTRVDEVADGIYRISTPVDLVPGGFSFNQYLVVDEEPLLFHTGPRRMFPLVREAVAAVLPVERLRHVGFSHLEADECGSFNEFLEVDASRSPRPHRATILSGRGRLDPSARRLGPWNSPTHAHRAGPALAPLAVSLQVAASTAVPPRLRPLTISASSFARGEYTGALMARGKKSRASAPKALSGVRGNGVLIEEMRAQNRATIEAVEASRVVLESKIDSLARETGGHLTVLQAAVRQNSRDIKKNSDDIRVLIERVDALGPLDQRVSTLERRVLGES